MTAYGEMALLLPEIGSKTGFGNRVNQTVGSNLNTGIAAAGMGLNKEIVIAAEQSLITAKTIVGEKNIFAIGQVAANAHIWAAHECKCNVAKSGQERLEANKEIEKTVPALVLRITQHEADFGAHQGIGHNGHPIRRSRPAIGIAKKDDIVPAGPYAQS